MSEIKSTSPSSETSESTDSAGTCVGAVREAASEPMGGRGKVLEPGEGAVSLPGVGGDLCHSGGGGTYARGFSLTPPNSEFPGEIPLYYLPLLRHLA